MRGKTRRALFVLLLSLMVLALYAGYSAYFSKSDPAPGLVQFDKYRERILGVVNPKYEILSVLDQGRLIRVNIFRKTTEGSSKNVEGLAIEALADIRSRIANQQVSASVWVYRTDRVERDGLLGMSFYHALTEQTVFKTPEELP